MLRAIKKANIMQSRQGAKDPCCCTKNMKS